MQTHTRAKLIEQGIKAADYKIFQENTIWSRYSNDKVDIGEELSLVIRTLNKALPLAKPLSALSIGSSAEPQFRILETHFRGGLYLLDVEKRAIDIIKERVRRQHTGHVYTILSDYKKAFMEKNRAVAFRDRRLNGKKMELVTLHHSLYYCCEGRWQALLRNLYREILGAQGAIHVVLMTAESKDTSTSTWLYNHFAGKYFNHKNDQDLRVLKKQLRDDPVFRNAQLISKTNDVMFFVEDFEKLMAVVWMILLYPDVHKYSLRQREEVTEFVFSNFWVKKRPIIQRQDHLVIYKGIGFPGLV